MADDDKPDDLTPEEIEANQQPDNTANPIAVARKRKTADQKAKEQAAVVGALLETAAGRAWLADLMFTTCGLFAPTENAAFDTNGLHFREGARAVGLILHKQALLADAKRYIDLVHENLDKM